MRKFRTTFMRGGTSKGCMFLRDDLPKNQDEWDDIFLQVMGNPDPKQLDGMGGTVSSNNKIVVVWKSEMENVDVEYLVGQVIVGENSIDYKSNCGNMTSAVGPFAVEMGLIEVDEPIANIHLYNHNTNKYIDVSVPIDSETKLLDEKGDCKISGIEGTAAQIDVKFLNPIGAKSGKLFPTGNKIDVLDIEGLGKIKVTITDVSNMVVSVKASDLNLKGTESVDEINSNESLCEMIEKIRGTAACLKGFAKDLEDAKKNSPAVPNIALVSKPNNFKDILGNEVLKEEMDFNARFISMFKCHKAAPLTAASAVAGAYNIEGTIFSDMRNKLNLNVRVANPSGIMELSQELKDNDPTKIESIIIKRTARKIMDGYVYIRN